MSLQRCQCETTSTEFLEWCDYIEQDLRQHHREDYYLAQIAAVVQRGYAKYPKQVKLEDYLFSFNEEKGPKKPRTEEEQKRQTAASKARWFAMVGQKTRTPPPQRSD